jgi:tripartite-type tricarboxylate transporter receptor subunit TctC
MKAALAALGFALAFSASAQYPDRSIHIIVPYAPGGGVDNLTRVVAERLGRRLQQAIIVDNKPGADGAIGADAAAKSAPDGYTLFMATSSVAAKKSLVKKLPYDAEADFVRIARIARAPSVLIVTPSLPVKNVADLVAYGKAHPATLSYGTPGVGSTQHLNAEILKSETGMDALHVPYKGGAPALIDILAGRVHFMMAVPSEVLSNIRAGTVRAIAVSGRERMPQLPELPTLAEAGLRTNPGQSTWWGLVAPAKTPPAVIERLARETLAILSDPETRQAIEAQGLQAAPLDAREFDEFFREEVKRYAELVKRFNIPAE